MRRLPPWPVPAAHALPAASPAGPNRRRAAAFGEQVAAGPRPLKVMISGAPAAGKGTQCENIVKKVRLASQPLSAALRRGGTASSCLLDPPNSPPSPAAPLQYNLVHISVGDLLRDQVKMGTPEGKRAKEFMDR